MARGCANRFRPPLAQAEERAVVWRGITRTRQSVGQELTRETFLPHRSVGWPNVEVVADVTDPTELDDLLPLIGEVRFLAL